MKKNLFLLMGLTLLCALFTVACSSDDDDEVEPLPIFDPYNANYHGKMLTTYDLSSIPGIGNMPGMGDGPVQYMTEKTTWNTVIDISRNRARINIEHAKFAEQMPEIALMVLDNLPYDPVSGTITATDVIPQVREGGALTPYEEIPFKSIKVTYDNTYHTAVVIDFSVDMTNMISSMLSAMAPTMPSLPAGTVIGTGQFRGDARVY